MATLTRTVTFENVLAAGLVGILSTISVYYYQRWRRNRVPTQWEPVGKVSRIFVYPLKSGHEVELDAAVCTEYGVMVAEKGNKHQFRDRSFLVYNETDKKFETARTSEKLMIVKIAAVDKDHVVLSAPDMPSLTLKVPNSAQNESCDITQFHGEKISCIDCGDEAADWITSVYITEKAVFVLVYPKLSNEATGLLSDFTSYLIVNQSTVDDLNKRIGNSEVTHRNFRPNIIIEGAPPYAEDNWAWFKIGNAILYTAKPCTRCALTTVNPENGVRSKFNEPLRTLRKYRLLQDVMNISLDGDTPLMGVNVGLQVEGNIKVGDVVYVVDINIDDVTYISKIVYRR
ncbi:hypothetical protein FQR65_LT07541 [Abscondita terminalis]|nr:hypothetical protein FQR65_LT07541 [Abscondita terminalis]